MRPWTLVACGVVALGACKPAGGRQMIEAGDIKWEVRGGAWEKQGNDVVGSGGHLDSLYEMTDGTLEVDIEVTPPAGDRTVGVGFRGGFVGDDRTKPNGYGFNLTSNRTWNAFRGAANAWTPINPQQAAFVGHPALQESKNHLTLVMKGDAFTIDVNGQRVTGFKDPTYNKGRLGFWVESTAQKMKLSNIRFTKG